ncbi:MAG: hypothetical protein IMF01_07055 [Proteobacteria bacterium]|nr:hypothetical protein [Pseudomonadota bacterium]
MRKMPTIFNRNYNPCRVFNMQHPDCDWVFNGEGVATRKWDGTCVMIENGEYFKRRTVKSKKQPPDDFILMDSNPITGKRFGWVPVTEDDKWHMEAYHANRPDGTYELVGPKVQGNAEDLKLHVLLNHRYYMVYSGILRTFDGIRDFMKDKDIEGIVFHHPDGRMAKIKKSDYGMERRPKR